MAPSSGALPEVVIGVDLGTTGVRSLAVDPNGNLVASSSQSLPVPIARLPRGWNEQSAEDWWQAATSVLQDLLRSLPEGTAIRGVSVVSTSGTILPIDLSGHPLHAALMYNDNRSKGVVDEVRQAGSALETKLGYEFSSSFALPKIVWLARHRPRILARPHRMVHATDFIVGRLTGNFDVSDHSNALKTGYDLMDERWPEFIEQSLGIALTTLPRVVAPGSPIGQIGSPGSRATRLPVGVPVFAGATDGTASQIASGAIRPGAWNASLGTTLVLKGISNELIIDPLHRIYSHRHPEGFWMPGGASNTGGEWIKLGFPGEEPASLDTLAGERIPTATLCYPLARAGERFPFRCSNARGFMVGGGDDRVDRYAAGLEGVALLERLAFETLTGLGVRIEQSVCASGGGSQSPLWLRIRASSLKRPLTRTMIGETAMGAALLAAAGVWYTNLSEAAKAMVHERDVTEPSWTLVEAYEEKYGLFCLELFTRGYIPRDVTTPTGQSGNGRAVCGL